MHMGWQALEDRLAVALERRGITDPRDIAWAAVWLQACGYPGLSLLVEAVRDDARALVLTRDALGLDLHNVSCAWLATGITADVKQHGRAFLRNVRHGLFLVPFSVRDGLAIGCPVDPAFALGGAREKNPYTEKLEIAQRDGLDVDDALLAAIEA